MKLSIPIREYRLKPGKSIEKIATIAFEACEYYTEFDDKPFDYNLKDFKPELLREEIRRRRKEIALVNRLFNSLSQHSQDEVSELYSDSVTFNYYIIGMLEQALSLGEE